MRAPLTDSAARPGMPSDGTRARLVSLDVLRGLTVAGMILVNAAAGMKWSAEAKVYPMLLHVPWQGLTFADLVFPSFLTMVGIAIPLSLAHARRNRALGGQILARTFRLLVLGFILSNLYWLAEFEGRDWRLFGVLQRIGLVYGACALMFLALGPKVRLGAALAILLLYWPLLNLPWFDGSPSDLAVRGQNFGAALDRFLLGDHRYVEGPLGYDPEGVLGTLPAIAHGLIGVAVGELLAGDRRSQSRKLAVIGTVMLVTGLAWSLSFPIIKDMWTSSFVLVTCGITILVLAGLHAWLDRSGEHGAAARAMLAVAVPFGSNAIAAYSLHMVTAEMPGWDVLLVPFEATRGALGDELASLIPVLLYMALIWLGMQYLNTRRWFVRI